MNPDQTALGPYCLHYRLSKKITLKQSDLGPYCLHYRLSKKITLKESKQQKS